MVGWLFVLLRWFMWLVIGCSCESSVVIVVGVWFSVSSVLVMVSRLFMLKWLSSGDCIGWCLLLMIRLKVML